MPPKGRSRARTTLVGFAVRNSGILMKLVPLYAPYVVPKAFIRCGISLLMERKFEHNLGDEYGQLGFARTTAMSEFDLCRGQPRTEQIPAWRLPALQQA